MARFLILHHSKTPARELMAKSSPEEMKAGMDSWMRWKDEAEKTVKFEWGMPLEEETKIALGKTEDSNSDITGYSIIEAGSKEAAARAMQNHPQLKDPGGYLTVLEMLPMPGM